MELKNFVEKLMTHGPITINCYFAEDGLITCKVRPRCCSCRRSFHTLEALQVHAREEHPRSHYSSHNTTFYNCFACGAAFYPYSHYVEHFAFKISTHDDVNYIPPLDLQKIVNEYEVCNEFNKLSFEK